MIYVQYSKYKWNSRIDQRLKPNFFANEHSLNK